jgi:hypothetical protein
MTNIGSFSIRYFMASQSIGERYGKLLVTDVIGSKSGNTIISYICDCDTIGQCELYRLKSGKTKSCGCLSKTHGESTTSLYQVWYSIKKRTTLKTHKRYADYGGRGIGICDEWIKYINFRKWALSNGWVKGLTIERKNNDLGYCPENCKVATHKEQNNNRRNNILIKIGEDTRTISEWADLKNIKYRVLWDRINRGWEQERWFSTPRKSPIRTAAVQSD